MKKTLAEILSDCREQMQQSIDTIDKLISESKDQGVEWPEVEEVEVFHFDGCPPLKKVTAPYCTGCFFWEQSKEPCPNGEFACGIAPKADHIIYQPL